MGGTFDSLPPMYRDMFQGIILRAIVAAFVLSVTGSVVQAQDYGLVNNVTIVGNQRVDSEAIKLILASKTGAVTHESVSKDIKKLYETGYFDQVTASIVDDKTLTYKVVEKPLVRKVFIKGNKDLDEDDLSDVVKFGDKRFLDSAKINTLKRSVSSYYQARGYNDVAIEHSVVPSGDNQVDLTFNIEEGRRYKLRSIKFRGLKEIDEDDLLDEIQTKRYKWWSSWLFGTGRLNSEAIEADRGLVRQYFLDHGYLEGTIGDPVVDIDKESGSIKLSFDVSEGSQFKIGKISASGDLVESSGEKTLEGITSKSGDVFSASTLRGDSFKISEKFGDKGYAFANVVPDTDVSATNKTVDINFQTVKGKPVSINRINIKGNDKTYDNVIRREIKVKEQELYAGSKVRRSQELLQRLGYFDEVSISNEPVPGADDKVDLNVNVKEAKSTGSFSIGAGYSTADGPIATARLTEANILGTGRKLDFNVDVGTERNNVSLGLTDRRFNDSHVSLGAEAIRSERIFDEFDRVLTGGSLTAGYPLEEVFGQWAEDISTSLEYGLYNVDIKDVQDDAPSLVKASEGSSISSSITPSLNRNTINNPLNPRKGSNQTLSYERGGLGGDEEFQLYEARNTLYVPLFDTLIGEFVFSNRTRFSYGDSLNDDPYPLFKRYFPGGINTVRGYGNRTLGPKEGDKEYGGAKQFINNAEVLFPLIEAAGIKGVVFYDMGNAYDDNESIDFSELRKSWGLGIRWLSPLGPLRLEFGWPINRKPGEDRTSPMFSFGVPF